MTERTTDVLSEERAGSFHISSPWRTGTWKHAPCIMLLAVFICQAPAAEPNNRPKKLESLTLAKLHRMQTGSAMTQVAAGSPALSRMCQASPLHSNWTERGHGLGPKTRCCQTARILPTQLTRSPESNSTSQSTQLKHAIYHIKPFLIISSTQTCSAAWRGSFSYCGNLSVIFAQHLPIAVLFSCWRKAGLCGHLASFRASSCKGQCSVGSQSARSRSPGAHSSKSWRHHPAQLQPLLARHMFALLRLADVTASVISPDRHSVATSETLGSGRSASDSAGPRLSASGLLTASNRRS